MVPRALQAAQKLEREQGVSVELIDLRSLNPFDWDTIAASVAKTNRALVAYQPILEDAILPQPNDLYLAMKELAEY